MAVEDLRLARLDRDRRLVLTAVSLPVRPHAYSVMRVIRGMGRHVAGGRRLTPKQRAALLAIIEKGREIELRLRA